jgi:DNA-directed RNA polymerase subunit F
MTGKEVKDSKAVSILEVEQILEKNSGATPTYEQQIALEHAKKVASPKGNEKAKKALEELKTMTEPTVIKILEVMPRSAMTLKQILAREKKTYTEEEIAKILEITKGK